MEFYEVARSLFLPSRTRLIQSRKTNTSADTYTSFETRPSIP